MVHDIPVKVMPANEAAYYRPPEVQMPQVDIVAHTPLPDLFRNHVMSENSVSAWVYKSNLQFSIGQYVKCAVQYVVFVLCRRSTSACR